MSIRRLAVMLLPGCLIAAVVFAEPVTSSSGRDLLRASAPGAYSVRYLPDRALISSSTDQESELRVYLPRAPRWGFVDGHRKPGKHFAWDARAGLVALKLPAERHSVQVGWAGNGRPQPRSRAIPLLVDGKQAGLLNARFSLDRMTADGMVDTPFGVARMWADANEDIACRDASVVLGVGGRDITQWRRVRGRYQGRGHVSVGGQTPIHLEVKGYNLMASPITSVEVELLSMSADATRVNAVPEDGILFEAEDFVDQGGGNVLISEGAHLDQHGGKSLYTFVGDGHWLEWEFEVPEAGMYDLFARVSCGDQMSFREVRIDGALPSKASRLVRFPGTGGWAHAPGEWWFMQLAGGDEKLPALKLGAGKHTLRLKGVFRYHLNVDYFVVKKR